MKFVYRVRADCIEGKYKNAVLTFGVDIFRDSAIYRSVPAIFTERRCAETLVRICNRAQLHPVHLQDILQDSPGCFSRQHIC